MDVLVTMGFNNGAMVENLRYWYRINIGWTPNKDSPSSVRSIVSLAARNIYFFRDDSIKKRTFLCFSKTEIIRKALKDKTLNQRAYWAWNECVKNSWFVRVTDDRYTFGNITNIKLISKQDICSG